MVQGDKAQFEASPLLLKSGSDVDPHGYGCRRQLWQPTTGKIAESLKAAGIRCGRGHQSYLSPTPTPIISGEHSGADGKPIFPNASFHVAETEWNFWVAPDLASKMPKEMEAMVKATQNQLAAIKEKVSHVQARS